MSNIDKRLRRDARALDDVQSNDKALAARLAMTPQQPAAQVARATPLSWWLAGGAVAAVVAALVLRLPQTPVQTPVEVAAHIVPPPTQSVTMQSLSDRIELQQVSRGAALEREWENLRKDLERTKAQVESDLSVSF
ncbi:MAG: hypothetical protein AAF270_08110 [Pseudomonadota bacterium]